MLGLPFSGRRTPTASGTPKEGREKGEGGDKDAGRSGTPASRCETRPRRQQGQVTPHFFLVETRLVVAAVEALLFRVPEDPLPPPAAAAAAAAAFAEAVAEGFWALSFFFCACSLAHFLALSLDFSTSVMPLNSSSS